jgi:phage terminase small subunit
MRQRLFARAIGGNLGYYGAMARRRLTLAEVSMLSPSEQARWRRRHKLTPRGDTGEFPIRPSGEASALPPPAWLSARHRALWDATVAAAPPGLLQPIDCGVLAGYVVQLGILEEVTAETGLEARRLVRQTAQSLAQLAVTLGLTPVLRAKLDLNAPPPKPVETGEDRWASLRVFPVITGGKKRPPGRREKQPGLR